MCYTPIWFCWNVCFFVVCHNLRHLHSCTCIFTWTWQTLLGVTSNHSSKMPVCRLWTANNLDHILEKQKKFECLLLKNLCQSADIPLQLERPREAGKKLQQQLGHSYSHIAGCRSKRQIRLPSQKEHTNLGKFSTLTASQTSFAPRAVLLCGIFHHYGIRAM